MGEAAGPEAAAERRFRFELPAHPGSPAQARRLTRARLNGWSVCDDICDTALLVITELVTNALVHTASTRIVCELHDGEDLMRIAVRDEGCAPGAPHPPRARPEEEHGRGLLLIDALCHAWGALEHGPGLLVWAELPRTTDEPLHDCGPCSRESRRGRAGAGGPSALSASRLRPTGLPAPAEAPPRANEPYGDLGWGARPKPGPEDGSEDDEPEALHGTRGTGAVGVPPFERTRDGGMR